MYSILNELKRRNVFRAATSYAIVSWVLIQAASAIFPALDAPSWVLKVLLLFIAAGFPMVIVLAWAYELTPQGIKRTSEVDSEVPTGPRTRVIDSILMIALVIALGITTAIGFTPGGVFGVTTDFHRSVESAPVASPRLAVMPFVTLNTDPDAVALAEGFAENIHSALAGDDDIDTVGIASSIRAARDKQTRSEMAKSLDAQYLLEGSLRANGDRIHVFAQLVAIPKGNAVWSHDFERSRNDLEIIQTHITAAVMNYFGKTAKDKDIVNSPPGAAFGQWQQAIGLMRDGGEQNLVQARVLLHDIIQHAPKFGPAHAALAFVICADPSASDPSDFHDRVNQVESLLDDAMSLAPQSRRVMLWRAQCESLLQRWRGRNEDFKRIDQQFDQALATYPDDSSMLTAYAEHQLVWGGTHKAIDLATKALKFDPLSSTARRIRVEALLRSGQYDLAAAAIEKLGDSDLALRLSARLAIARGNLQQALAVYNRISGDGDPMPIEAARVWATLGDVSRANRVIERRKRAPVPEIWKLALNGKYADAYALAKDKLQPDDPQNALLLGLLAVQAGQDSAALKVFSKFFSDWVHDTGPLRGTAALRYAPWYARALMASGDDTAARRLLDRHLAGVILVERGLSTAESGLYFAANFAVANRRTDAERALAQAINSGLRLTRGALGDPVDLKDSQLFASLRRNDLFSKLM